MEKEKFNCKVVHSHSRRAVPFKRTLVVAVSRFFAISATWYAHCHLAIAGISNISTCAAFPFLSDVEGMTVDGDGDGDAAKIKIREIFKAVRWGIFTTWRLLFTVDFVSRRGQKMDMKSVRYLHSFRMSNPFLLCSPKKKIKSQHRFLTARSIDNRHFCKFSQFYVRLYKVVMSSICRHL